MTKFEAIIILLIGLILALLVVVHIGYLSF
jgi:hypothetical protein